LFSRRGLAIAARTTIAGEDQVIKRVAIETSCGVCSPVVFLGPSLARAEAEALIAADYRPPIRRGDLEAVERGRPVVILDGEFDQSLSVSPKEILRCLEAGSVVLGASSMGALRAAELAPLGMIGVGRIFELYRTGQIDGDDEVAVSYCPLTMQAHTIPLVNIRCWLESARCAGCLESTEPERILRRARRIFYADRTPERMLAVLGESLGAERFANLCARGLGEIRDVKADDARTALAATGRFVR
jgi:TfuA protein